MSKFVFLFIALAIVHASNALMCKKCGGPNDPTCAKVEDQTCDNPANTKSVCLWKVIKDSSNKETVTKMCAYPPMSKAKYECVENTRDIVKCDSCEKDFCNSASSVGISFFAAISVAFALFAPKFL